MIVLPRYLGTITSYICIWIQPVKRNVIYNCFECCLFVFFEQNSKLMFEAEHQHITAYVEWVLLSICEDVCTGMSERIFVDGQLPHSNASYLRPIMSGICTVYILHLTHNELVMLQVPFLDIIVFNINMLGEVTSHMTLPSAKLQRFFLPLLEVLGNPTT